MQGLPTNLLTQNVASAAGKTESSSNSTLGVSGNGGVVAGKESKESKNLFAEIFSSLLGSSQEKAEGNVVVKAEGTEAIEVEGKVIAKGLNHSAEKSEITKRETAESTPPEVKLDVLLKNKEEEKKKKVEISDLSNEKVLPPDVLASVDKLINRVPVNEVKIESQFKDKAVSNSSSLENLLKNLKNDNSEVALIPSEESAAPSVKSPNAKETTPLDFLIKESKINNIGAVDSRELKTIQSNPEVVSKLGLSSEDFISQKSEKKDLKNLKTQIPSEVDELSDLKLIGQKQINQSLKSYGQKQNILNDGVIRNTKDLAFSEQKKSKAGIDELTSPDMKIGADLSLVKDSFIPLMQKNEIAQNTTLQDAPKVLDLSKINTSNTTEIIKKISDYIEQSQVANSNTMDLTVKHDSLGQFKIQVNRPAGQSNQMDMQITTTTAEGHDFFMKNEIGLMKNLSQAGVQLSDLRIISGGEGASFSSSDSRQNSNSQNNSQAGREFMSFEASGDSSHGSDRRRQLWQEARNNQQRYGA